MILRMVFYGAVVILLRYDNLATLYAILKTLEHLEKAYIRDAITADECASVYLHSLSNLIARYQPACEKLLAQYKVDRLD